MASWSRGGSRKGVEKGSAGGLICTLQILTLSSTVLTLRGGGRSLNSKLRTLSAAAAQLQCRRRRLRGTAALEGKKAATAFSIHPPLTSGLGLFPPSAGITILLGKLALVLLLRTLPCLFFSLFTRPPLGSIRGGILSVCDPLRLLCASAAAALLPSSLSQFEKLCPWRDHRLHMPPFALHCATRAGLADSLSHRISPPLLFSGSGECSRSRAGGKRRKTWGRRGAVQNGDYPAQSRLARQPCLRLSTCPYYQKTTHRGERWHNSRCPYPRSHLLLLTIPPLD